MDIGMVEREKLSACYRSRQSLYSSKSSLSLLNSMVLLKQNAPQMVYSES